MVGKKVYKYAIEGEDEGGECFQIWVSGGSLEYQTWGYFSDIKGNINR